MMNQLSVELAEELNGDGVVGPVEQEGLTPLEYMLRVMNDPKEDSAVRRQMATVAALYVHPKAGEVSKKEDKNEKAKSAGQGKFAPTKIPLSLVK